MFNIGKMFGTRAQLRLARIAEQVLPWRGFEEWTFDAGPLLTLVFDDGELSDLPLVEGVLAQHRAKAVFAVSSGHIGGENYLDAEQLQRLACYGHELCCHMHMHVPVTAMRQEEVERDMRRSHLELSAMFPHYVRALAYPFGANSLETRRMAARHFDCALSAWPGLNRGRVNRYALRRVAFERPGGDPALGRQHYQWWIDEAIREGAWLIFMLHTGKQQEAWGQAEHLSALLDYAALRGLEPVTLSYALGMMQRG